MIINLISLFFSLTMTYYFNQNIKQLDKIKQFNGKFCSGDNLQFLSQNYQKNSIFA